MEGLTFEKLWKWGEKMTDLYSYLQDLRAICEEQGLYLTGRGLDSIVAVQLMKGPLRQIRLILSSGLCIIIREGPESSFRVEVGRV